MFAKQYCHRLPADYPMSIIRQRAAERGPLWDRVEGLVFKVFAGRERGVHGASENLYASLYLWQDAAGAGKLLMGPGFQGVIDSFGRPHIESWLPLDWRRGPAQQALSLYREVQAIEPGADRQQLLAAEVQRNQQLADAPETFAVFLALDLQAWQLLRFSLSAQPPQPRPGVECYEVLYLAQG
ncbi:DUF4865 family protein [Pseudomonas sp. Fl5BN2]|uniref:DUF4865 family protein n=1 Tax=unclassified Pseudomonas TaxID=196821 RepID=UPI001376FC21|nr:MULTISPECIES: DUF4865 family protein [unclassified Pseudomonas]NBF06734.1 DUF4865 family protein [Pseudomonas sp. Fl5BN2]NBF11780.1 DUF4865 family protein [Pseudomonas sp. Fl4BN1]